MEGDPVEVNSYLPYPQVDFERVILDKVKVSIEEHLRQGPDIPINDVQLYLTHIGKRAVLRLQGWVAGKPERTIHVEHRWPADWWQAFRERWFPGWWLRRWPVRYKEVRVHEVVWRVCPHLHVNQEDPRHLNFLLQRED